MTKKLYWESPYETKFSAKVELIEENGIILDQTLFYPESGNQLSDKGKLKVDDNKFNIEKVTKEEDGILHHISTTFNGKISLGDEVSGEIDWKNRFGLMRAHSSQHVFSAVLKNKYDIDTSRANLNFEEIFLQMSQKLDPNQLKETLLEVNAICTVNKLNIKSKIIPRDQAVKISDKIRSKIPNEPQIRLMEIENLDLVCCGGTHVQTTNEIGNIFIFDFKKGNEIRYYVGNKALSMSSRTNIDMLTLINELNTSLEKFRDNAIKRLETIKKTQEQQQELSSKLLGLISKSPYKVINNIPLYHIDFDIDIKILNKSLDMYRQDSLLVVEKGSNKIRVLSLSKKIDANKLLQELITIYKGKGGGNPKSAQAELEEMPENLLIEVEKIIKSY
ncbi:MAG: alanyl-tRNA editing protein [Promethearchaeota archaeon]|jgi:alanyl-tRNA synthetase